VENVGICTPWTLTADPASPTHERWGLYSPPFWT
jgi:hypothetical protein